jgi:septal ring factor EnvC (AmiA/AmiB activator)
VVRAVCGGKVLFADWFKGYDKMMIIDHGDNYYTVYAHMDALAKQKGAGVAAGDQIGVVGEAGLDGFHKLYFEVRHHGKPQDPAEWLKIR